MEARLEQYDHAQDFRWFSFFDGQGDAYRTRNALVLWGDDFSHIHADKSLTAAKRIIDGLSESTENVGKYKIHFSTMS